MKDYSEYSKIFDILSKHCPDMFNFIDTVQGVLKEGSKVCDVGGGTGLFIRQLQDSIKGLEVHFVEPSPHMRAISETRVQGTIHDKEFKEVVDKIPKQDMFLFMRSFYCLYDTFEQYLELPAILHKKLNKGGMVGIYRVGTKQYPLDNKQPFLTDEENKIFTATKMEFNRLVSTGKFHILNNSQLDQLFINNGFEVYYRNNLKNIYRKI